MYSAIAANKRNSLLTMTTFVVILGLLGWIAGQLLGQPSLLYIALLVGGVYAFIQYFAAAKLALAMNGAKEVTKRDAPRLYRTVENISIATGLPMPKVYVIDDPGLNAFATGRDPAHAIVAATAGLVDIMNDTELEAVVAHEMGHIKNFDIRLNMIVFGMVAAIGLIADSLLHLLWFWDEDDAPPFVPILALAAGLLAPFVALLVQLAVSRQREYLADSTGVMTTRYPDGLVRALEKIRDHGSTLKRQNTTTAHLFFANPLKRTSLAGLLSTHPPIEDRIARLKHMGDKL